MISWWNYYGNKFVSEEFLVLFSYFLNLVMLILWYFSSTMSLTFDEIVLLNISCVRFVSVSGKRTWFVGNVEECLVFVSCVVISTLVVKYLNGLLLAYGTKDIFLSVLIWLTASVLLDVSKISYVNNKFFEWQNGPRSFTKWH